MARDDLENAKQLAAVSTKLAHDQVDQANLQAKVTREELQEQLRQAEVNYERAKLQADRTVVRATTAGVVSEIPVRLGDRVPGGAVLARLAKLDHMIAEVPVAAQMISELSLGQSAQSSALPPGLPRSYDRGSPGGSADDFGAEPRPVGASGAVFFSPAQGGRQNPNHRSAPLSEHDPHRRSGIR